MVRVPTHPGEMLLEEFLKPLALTQRELADAIQVPYQPVSEIVKGRRGVTPGTALRLGKVFGTSAAFWMNLQLRGDPIRHRERKRMNWRGLNHWRLLAKGSYASPATRR